MGAVDQSPPALERRVAPDVAQPPSFPGSVRADDICMADDEEKAAKAAIAAALKAEKSAKQAELFVAYQSIANNECIDRFDKTIQARAKANLPKLARELAKAAEANGGDWRRAVADAGVDADFFVFRDRTRDAVLPWSIIDGGMKDTFFRNELDKSIVRTGSTLTRPNIAPRARTWPSSTKPVSANSF